MTFEEFMQDLLCKSYDLESRFSYDDWCFDGENEYVKTVVAWCDLEDAIKKAYETGYNTGWEDSKTSDEPWGY